MPHSPRDLPLGRRSFYRRQRQTSQTWRHGREFTFDVSALCQRRDVLTGTGKITLVLGGARSGKSRRAETLIQACPPPWTYIATAEPFDTEMAERIAAHQGRRDARWLTLDAPRSLPRTLDLAPADAPVLVDCLTLWLSNLLLAEQAVDPETEALEAALRRRVVPTVLVSNEVGWGIVPATPLGRRFRDAQGWLNQRIAALANHVELVVAGLPLTLK